MIILISVVAANIALGAIAFLAIEVASRHYARRVLSFTLHSPPQGNQANHKGEQETSSQPTAEDTSRLREALSNVKGNGSKRDAQRVKKALKLCAQVVGAVETKNRENGGQPDSSQRSLAGSETGSKPAQPTPAADS